MLQSLAQIGACGLFLLRILAAIPRSLRHARETVRQLWFVGAMSLIIIMTCGLFVGMVLGLQLYHVLVDLRRYLGHRLGGGPGDLSRTGAGGDSVCCLPDAQAPR